MVGELAEVLPSHVKKKYRQAKLHAELGFPIRSWAGDEAAWSSFGDLRQRRASLLAPGLQLMGRLIRPRQLGHCGMSERTRRIRLERK